MIYVNSIITISIEILKKKKKCHDYMLTVLSIYIYRNFENNAMITKSNAMIYWQYYRDIYINSENNKLSLMLWFMLTVLSRYI